MEGMNSGATSYACSGVAWSVRATSTGSWTAHILAGTALLLWALHWNQAIFRGWLTQGRTQRPFRSHATYPVPFLPERWPVEAVAKVVLPLVAILVTLVGSSGWRSNICSEGTPREGHFDPENIYRYANVWVLFSVLASGLVDLLGCVVELPEGTASFFTAAVFMLQSFLLVEQQYTDMLEGMVYYVMFLVSSGTAIFTLGEIVWPQSFMTSCGRVYCTYMQAIWYFGAAHILHEGRVAWDTRHPLPDMAPAAFVPVPFVFLMNVCSLCMFLGWVVMRQAMGKQRYSLVSGNADSDATRATGNGHKPKEGAANELVPLVSRI